MKKKIIPLLLLLLVAFCFYNTPERRVMRFYRCNISSVKENIENHFENDEPLKNYFGADTKDYIFHRNCIEYTVVAKGFSSQTSYYSIFCELSDSHEIYDNVEYKQISENEWEWQESDGDNHGYIRKLEPYWYYSEIHY